MILELLKKYHKMGMILIPLTINEEGEKIPLISYKGYKEKRQDWTTLQGLYETFKDIKPLQWAVYGVNNVVGIDWDTPKDFETFFDFLLSELYFQFFGLLLQRGQFFFHSNNMS